MTSKRIVRGLLLVTFLAVLAHLWWWYRPGERAALPSANLAGPGSEDVAWIWLPFPHLNLSELEGGIEESDRVLSALARLAGFGNPRELPTFGPFAVPPARDLVVALGEGGDRLRLEASVDPVLAAIARLAGMVARNPWLSGGEVETSAGIVKVGWSGNRWRAVRGGLLPGASSNAFELLDDEPALAAVVLSRSSRRVPAGTLVLRRNDNYLEMDLEGSNGEPALGFSIDTDKLIFLLLEGQDAGGPDGLLFFATERRGGLRLGSRSLSPPGTAVIHPPQAESRDLPGEKIFRLTEGKPVRLSTSSWDVVSYSMEQARIAAELAESVRSRLVDAEEGKLEFAVTVRPAAAEAEIGSLLELLAEFPLSSKEERQRWRDAHQILLALASLERVTLVTGVSSPEFHLVLFPVETGAD